MPKFPAFESREARIWRRPQKSASKKGVVKAADAMLGYPGTTKQS
jgi:hypothetical protein